MNARKPRILRAGGNPHRLVEIRAAEPGVGQAGKRLLSGRA